MVLRSPVALYPATSESEKVSFNQLNRKTGHRIKYAKVDADTGEEVANEDIVKDYKVDTDTFVEVTKEERETVRMNQLPTRRFRLAQLNRLTPLWSSTNSGIARVTSVSRTSVSVRLSRISH